MPTPFMCHGCDKPTMNKSGICDSCIESFGESTTADDVNEMYLDLKKALDTIDELRKKLHMIKELAMMRDNYGFIESIAEEALNEK